MTTATLTEQLEAEIRRMRADFAQASRDRIAFLANYRRAVELSMERLCELRGEDAEIVQTVFYWALGQWFDLGCTGEELQHAVAEAIAKARKRQERIRLNAGPYDDALQQ